MSFGPQDTMALRAFLHDRALVGICRRHGGLCLLTVVSGSIPGPIYGAFPLHGTVQYGSLLGGFPLGTVPGTFFSTTSAEVPSDPYHYQNVTCKLYCSLIGRRTTSLLHH